VKLVTGNIPPQLQRHQAALTLCLDAFAKAVHVCEKSRTPTSTGRAVNMKEQAVPSRCAKLMSTVNFFTAPAIGQSVMVYYLAYR
jgi:hypothetical protein